MNASAEPCAAFRDPTARTADRVSTPVPSQVDVAIVGAGPAGLTAAAYLARLGKKVAVFDPHYVAGGSATQFARGRAPNRYRFDVGLHYIGECLPHEPGGRMLTELGILDRLGFVPLDPDGYDVLVFPDFTFKVPAGLDVYRDRLVALFPEERPAIDRFMRYIRDVHRARQWTIKNDGRTPPWLGLAIVFGAWRVVRHLKSTLGQLLDTCGVRDPKLRALIAAQQGDYGLPPGEVAALVHGGFLSHFSNGAWYPKGGGQAIADVLADSIEENGGAICLRQRVERIRVEGGRAVGVDVVSHKDVRRSVQARYVISGADLKHTMLELVDPEHVPEPYRVRTDQFEMAGALFLTCLGIRGTPDELRGLGLGAFNTWQFDGYTFDEFYQQGRIAGPLPLKGAYITSGALKDPEPGSHAPIDHATLEVMAMVPGDPVHWGVEVEGIDRRRYRHGERYQQLKQGVEDELVARTEALYPGVADRIEFRESATPISNIRFTGATFGASYGIAGTPSQSHDDRPDERSPIANLFLCGASMRSYHGIFGAMGSGRAAARRVIEAAGGKLGGPRPVVLPATLPQ